jgi:Iron-containing redox enzyme
VPNIEPERALDCRLAVAAGGNADVVGRQAQALFPDTFYAEILGYNLGIEMFGLGELRMHEIQKLRHWGLDTCYEEAHLSIDNVSAGHGRQSAEIIASYLDGIERQLGAQAVQREWRRIWNGYASFAWFVERGLCEVPTPQPHQECEDGAIVI